MKVSKTAYLAAVGALVFGAATGMAADRPVVSDDFAVTQYSGEGVMEFVVTAELPAGWAIVPSSEHPAGDSVVLPADGTVIVSTLPDGTEPVVIGGDLEANGPALTLFTESTEIELNHLRFGFARAGGGAVLYGSDFGPRYGRPVFEIGEVAVSSVTDSSVVLEAPVYMNQMAARGMGNSEAAGALIGTVIYSARGLDRAALDVVDSDGDSTTADGFVAGNGPGGGPSGPNGSDVFTLFVGENDGGGGLSKYGTIGGITAYSIATVSCNQGDEWAVWLPNANQHPLVAQNLFRINDGRFEQIGMSWLKHTWCAADFFGCAGGGSANGNCSYMTIGIADVYSAGLNATQPDLGPRSEVNAASGQYPYPYGIGWNASGNSIYKRHQIQNSDLAGSSGANGTDTRYLMEAYYITTDEAPNNTDKQYNNASWRRVLRGGLSGGGYLLSWSGVTTVQETALEAWPQFDINPDGYAPAVVDLYVPEEEFNNGSAAPDGRLVIGYDITPLPDGMWAYDYTIYNYNSNRNVRSLTINLPDADYETASHHSPFYHSGEPHVQSSWDITADAKTNTITFSTDEYNGSNELSANVIRWSTAHSFHLETTLPPNRASASVGFFIPGTINQKDAQLFGPAADCNGNEQADALDIVDGIEDDVNGNGIPDVCEPDILIIEGQAVGGTTLEFEPTGTVGDAFALRLTGDAGNTDIACVDAYIQPDGTLGAAPVNQTIAQWGTVVVTGAEIVPDASYTATPEGAAGNTLELTTWPWADLDNNQLANLADAQLAVIEFQNSTYSAVADVEPCGGNDVINLADVQTIVGVWQGNLTYAAVCGVPCP